jgi:nucleoside-diphosphate-sugar epimerase
MRLLITGGSGVLGRALLPMLQRAGHHVTAPSRHELDLFDERALAGAVAGRDGIYHLATRIPPPDRMPDPAAWAENDRLRTEASRLLVDAGLADAAGVFVQPSIALVYPPGPADERTPVADVPAFLASTLIAEANALRFEQAGRRGVVLRLGLLYGPTTGADRQPEAGATLHVDDAASALAAALEAPSGVYNVTEDDNPVSNAHFAATTGWRPRR